MESSNELLLSRLRTALSAVKPETLKLQRTAGLISPKDYEHVKRKRRPRSN